MQIIHEGAKYNLDIQKAIELNVLTKIPQKRPVHVGDIPNESLFKCSCVDSTYYYLMIDNKKKGIGQCLAVSDNNPYLTFLSSSTELSYLDISSQEWISEVDIND